MVARHRNFQNQNYNDELDEDALSDGGEEYISPEHQALLNDGLDRVRDVVGSADHSGLSDSAIKDVLWDCNFDIEETVQWAMEELERHHQAQQRKDTMKDLPPLPPPTQERELGYGEYSPPPLGPQRVIEESLSERSELGYGQYSPHVPGPWQAAEDDTEPEERSHVPLIKLAQRQYDTFEPELMDAPVKRNLSTISEHTERTELSPNWPPRQQYMSLPIPRPPSSVTTSYGQAVAAREREKAQKLLAQKQVTDAKSVSSSRAASPMGNLSKGSKKSTPIQAAPTTNLDPHQLDMSALNLLNNEPPKIEEAPKIAYAREKLLEEVKRTMEAQKNGKKSLSLVVIGHVDAGKSTLMGRLLYELGRMNERTRTANERNSTKAGKGSFSWAWGLDGTAEERERGITMDIAQQSFSTPHRHITILDAPGHKEFIPNMISGASQADCALLVVDASTGEFEAGFERGGQTREHLILTRSLGVSQVIVAINKLDQVQWDKDRYNEICTLLRPFLVQSGYSSSRTKFAPVGAMLGVNLVNREGDEAKQLQTWYNGPTLVDLLDQLEAPTHDISAPARIPLSNIFKGQGSGTSVSGRLLSGVVQVGERLRVLPGDETAVIKTIDNEEENVPWAAAGANLTLALVSIDPIQLTIGSVLCPPTDPVPLASSFTARIIIFDIQVPIISGAMVELFHHSRDVPATVSKLVATLDRTSGKVLKNSPRVLTKASSAEVQITLRSSGTSGPAAIARPIPLEPYAINKAMGRILIRREGETIAAGVVMTILG